MQSRLQSLIEAWANTLIGYVINLAVVYLNTGRDREAEAAFERVRTQNVIGAKDPEYAAFQRQSCG